MGHAAGGERWASKWSFICISSAPHCWHYHLNLPPALSAAALDSYRSSNSTMNCTCEDLGCSLLSCRKSSGLPLICTMMGCIIISLYITIIEIKYTINVMRLNHPETIPIPATQSMEKMSSTKPVSGAKEARDCCISYPILEQWQNWLEKSKWKP